MWSGAVCGSARESPLSEEPVLHVLFICTGNICRSPTAERLAAAYGARFQVPDFKVSSAGTRAMIAHPIHRDARSVLENLGGDATDFAARQLTPRIAADADLILAMTKAHRDRVLELAPHRLNRTFTLTEASGLVSKCGAQTVGDLAAFRQQLTAQDRSDISDPIGQSPAVFATVGSQIADFLAPILELCHRASISAGKLHPQ